MKRKELILGGIFSGSFLFLASFFRDFVLDDAYIIYRYSQNLIQGFGLRWNPGEDPVEGYTSFLWVILNAAALRLQADPVTFSRMLAGLSTLAVIWLLIRAGRPLHWGVAGALAGAIALSPAQALLAMQGLETVCAGLLILLGGIVSLRLSSRPSAKNFFLWYLCILLAFLTRPDTAAFFAANWLVVFVRSAVQKEKAAVQKILLIGAPFFLIFVLYMSFRWSYFGYFFPNTFYIKVLRSRSNSVGYGFSYLFSFFKDVFWPYLVFWMIFGARRTGRRKFFWVLPVLCGVVFFLGYILVVIPVQGFGWRYIFAVYPALILAGMELWGDWGRNLQRRWEGALVLVLAGVLGLWSFHLLPKMRIIAAQRTPRDRVIIGRRLAGIPGVMFTSESGALPYFSGWRSVDWLGLTSEEIAHHGLSREILTRIHPDLIMMKENGEYRAEFPDEKLVRDYIIADQFVAVAAIHKSFDQYHYYFVRQQSRFYPEIVRSIRQAPGVEYGDLEELVSEEGIMIYEPGE